MMFRTILYPTDFSPLGNAALPYAVLLAGAFRAKLVLLHVFPPTGAKRPEAARHRADCIETLQQLAAQALTQLTDRLTASPRRILYRAEPGAKADRVILRQASAGSQSLIVLATRGHGGITANLLGSVSSKVIQNARCPVIALRLPFGTSPDRLPMRLKLRRILLPTDLSPYSLRAFPIACAIARPFQSRITVLHVTNHATDREARETLEPFVRKHHPGMNSLDFVTRHGKPAEEILTHALHFNFDLIAMTTQGAHLLRERLFGSTTERVLRDATRPLLIVR